AVGHNVATRAVLDADRQCREVHTRWIPSAEVEFVAPAPIQGVELAMENLAALADAGVARAQLIGLVKQYRDWIAAQRAKMPSAPKNRKDTAQALLSRPQVAADRIEAGLGLLADPTILEAFRIANRVMATAGRRRFAIIEKMEPSAVAAPRWRPFQLAFLL